MARKKNPSESVGISNRLAERLRAIRIEIFGEHGGPELARRMGIPARNWYNYETGVTVPGEVLLGFIEQTGANPTYLATGEGPRYVRPENGQPASERSLAELLRSALEKVESLAGERIAAIPTDASVAEYVALPVVPLSRIGDDIASKEKILAGREWIANPSRTIAVRVPDDAMHPVLPAGSIAAIDRSTTDPRSLQGKVVAARPEGRPMIRWLEVSGRHLILRPNQPSREFPIIPIELGTNDAIVGQVVCSWNRLRDV